MKKIVFFLMFVVHLQVNAQDQKITTFILVRHAEKATSDPDTELSEKGQERAERLSQLLTNASITSIYSTKYRRTQNTVAPTAKSRNLTIKSYEKFDQAALQELVAMHSGGTLLIAGHSNTIPGIANLLLGKNEFQNFPDSEYGNILIVSVTEVGKRATVVRLSY